MKTYSIVTLCGVVTRYQALSSYAAATQARIDGWHVVQVIQIHA